MRSEALTRPAEGETPLKTPPWPTQILDTLEQAVVGLDRERRVVYNNRRFEELLGVEAGTLLGQPGSRLFPGADARWLKGGSREPREFKLEAEGREFTLKAEALPMRDEEGDPIGSVILGEAISESEDGEFQKKIDRLVSLGELSAYAVAKFGPGARHFDKIEGLLAEVRSQLAVDVTFLIKGSRFMQMERVVKHIEL